MTASQNVPDPQSARDDANGGCGVLCAATVALAIFAVGLLLVLMFRESLFPSPHRPFVVLDTELVMAAGFMDERVKTDPDFASTFVEKVNEGLGRYKNAGQAVVSKAALASYPEARDVTRSFVEWLGIDWDLAVQRSATIKEISLETEGDES